jgi:hypothetical protein
MEHVTELFAIAFDIYCMLLASGIQPGKYQYSFHNEETFIQMLNRREHDSVSTKAKTVE